MTGRFRNWLDDRLNNLKIKKKLFLLYFYCMILPLVLTDAVIIGLIVKREYDQSCFPRIFTLTSISMSF